MIETKALDVCGSGRWSRIGTLRAGLPRPHQTMEKMYVIQRCAAFGSVLCEHIRRPDEISECRGN